MKKTIKIQILIFISILITFSLAGCYKSDNEKNTKSNTVIIGYDNTFVPMGFLDNNNNPTGFDIDLAKEVFSRINIKVKFQNIDWSMKDVELNSGNVDVLWNGYTLTNERQKQVDYSKPYLSNSQVIVVSKQSGINTKKDLTNKIVATQQGSSSLDLLNNNNELVSRFKNKEPVLYDTFDNAFRDLKSKRVDAVIVDDVLAKYYISRSKDNNFKILNETLGKEEFVVGFKKGNTKLRDKVNTALDEIKKDNTFDKIYKKWFNK